MYISVTLQPAQKKTQHEPHLYSSVSASAFYLACVAVGFLGFLNFYYRTRAEKIKEGANPP